MLGMKNHFDISGSIKIREVDIAGVACKLKNDTSSTFAYLFLHAGATSRCPRCGVGTILCYHYFMVVPKIL